MGQLCSRRDLPPELDKSIVLIPNQVPTIAYCDKKKRWVQVDASLLQTQLPLRKETDKKITTLTWNVWFEAHLFDERTAEIRKIIQNLKADVICLQEVTQPFWVRLLNEKWVREGYYVSGNSMRGYGVMVLSRYPFNFFEYPFRSFMGRSLLLGTGAMSNVQSVTIATAHFESANSAPSRKAQLELTFEKLKNFPNPILMGDFNFDNPEEKKNLSEEYSDVWELLRQPDEEYHTMKPKPGLTPWRPDKVLVYKTIKIVPKTIKRIGTEPLAKYASIDTPGFITTPSDHYGLYGEFNIEPTY